VSELFRDTTKDEAPSRSDVEMAERYADRAREQRDAAKRRTAELESEVDGLEVQLQQLQARADRLAGAVRRVVDNPLDAPDLRQGQLLSAIQRWDSGKV
jgi:predicted  nucleic acid-binding Zn-ribbon protein